MNIDVHVITVEDPDSKAPATMVFGSKMEAAIGLIERYAEDDDEFTQFCLEMDPLIVQEAGLHIMPLDQLIQRLEEHYSLTIRRDLQVVEVEQPLVDPTPFVEHVCKTIWTNGDNTPPWEDLGPVVRQEMKQGILPLLYDVLNALTDQGLIGGIDNRG